MHTPKIKRAVQLALAASLILGVSVTGAAAATCVGVCGVLGANGDVTAPPSGLTYGFISTYGGVDGGGQIVSVGGTDGSAYTTSAFTANAGDLLRYYFNYVTSDGQDGPGQFIYEDYAWAQLLNATTGTPLVMLFNGRTEPSGFIVPGSGLPPVDGSVVLTPSSVAINAGASTWDPLGTFSGQCWGGVGNGCGNTGWIMADYILQTGGSYMLQFGVTNWGDTVYDSGLAYAGIQIGGTPIEPEDFVPEPSSWAMMLAGMAGLGIVARRRRALPALR